MRSQPAPASVAWALGAGSETGSGAAARGLNHAGASTQSLREKLASVAAGDTGAAFQMLALTPG
ncbi:hypothetical protein [Deinococcus cavernae]|uniref:hypothetical protein n=1 Tax=Deinococcus cavernae TaxID=2320857 RepID=UPI0011C23AA8|nr:hypothetical protein [Deinococcus cavernae]